MGMCSCIYYRPPVLLGGHHRDRENHSFGEKVAHGEELRRARHQNSKGYFDLIR
jgi:hypothetical protein